MVDFFSRKQKALRAAAREGGYKLPSQGPFTGQQQVRRNESHTRNAPKDKPTERFVTFVPKEVAEQITDPDVAIISITGKYDSHAKISAPVPRLHMSFGTTGDDFNKQFDEVDHRAIMTFIDANPSKNIVVHCGEGRMRSPAIAEGIAHATDMETNLDYPGCRGSLQQMDRGIYRAFVGFTFEMQVAADKAQVVDA